ncbi:MAG TPA: hypothetical protein VLE89_09030 [Chlamydiales bacterium]|nr:hypothetical protein [Chlamydiales bacterium]
MSGNNIDVLKEFNRLDLISFVDTFNGNKYFGDRQIEDVSKKLVDRLSLGFCRRLSIIFSSDEQKIARKIAEVVKIHLNDLPEVNLLAEGGVSLDVSISKGEDPALVMNGYKVQLFGSDEVGPLFLSAFLSQCAKRNATLVVQGQPVRI